MQVIIGHILHDPLPYISASHQYLQFFRNRISFHIYERTDNRIITGVFPEALRSGIRIILQSVNIIQHIPWAIDIESSKVITIIPCPNQLRLILITCICKDPLHIRLREAKIFVQPRIRNCIGNKIIGSSKNALLRDLQAACDHCKLQITVIFQRSTHNGTNDLQHLIIIAMGTGFCHRDIIFIQQ